MTDTTIHELRPGDMSGLAHAQPVPDHNIRVDLIPECFGVRVISTGRKETVLDVLTHNGRHRVILSGLPFVTLKSAVGLADAIAATEPEADKP